MNSPTNVPIGQLMSVHPTVQEALSGLGFSDLASERGGAATEAGLSLAEVCRRRNVGLDRVLLALDRARRAAGILDWPQPQEEAWPGPDALIVEVLERVPGSHDAFHELGIHPCQCFNLTVAEAAKRFGVKPDEIVARLRNR